MAWELHVVGMLIEPKQTSRTAYGPYGSQKCVISKIMTTLGVISKEVETSRREDPSVHTPEFTNVEMEQ